MFVKKLFTTHKIKFCAFLIFLLMFFAVFFDGYSVHAEVRKIDFNGSSSDVSVSGFLGTSSNGDYFVDSTIAFNFSGLKKRQFNQFSITYTSSDVLRGVFTYKTADMTLSEEFFLEKGINIDFTSFVETTIVKDGKNQSGLFGLIPLQLTFEPLRKNEIVLFNLSSLKTAVSYRDVDETVYIENNHYKLGVYLAWGGGINYVEDKLDGDETVTNMINYHDAGRLIQQSYYGTASAPYVCGNYNGTPWGYNPVQGGNLFGQKSKLIDFKIEDNYIYVKCRPRDWAKLNEYSIAYMENTYILHDDHIEVKNKFIDFSTYNHGDTARHQELPAFYTISYLDTFTFYNGANPWKNDTLTIKKDLPFWGDSKNASECYTNIDRANTETWFSWTSSETGHGIGVYTPQIEMVLAGMFQPDGSKDPKGNATNYVAPIVSNIMRNWEPFEYTYLIATGDVDTIRSTFKEHQDGLDWKETIDYTHIDFDTLNDLKAFTKAKSCTLKLTEEGILRITASGENGKSPIEAVINTSLQSQYQDMILGNDYNYFVYTYMVPKSNSSSKYSSRIYFCQGNNYGYSEEKSIPIELICDGKYHTEIIDLTAYKDVWATSGESSDTKLNSIKITFLEESSLKDKIYISCIGLAPDNQSAIKYGNDAKKTDPVSFDPSVMQYTQAEDITPTPAPTPTPTPTPTNTDKEDGTSMLVILIGAGIGAVLIALLVFFIVMKSLKKIKKQKNQKQL